MVPYLRARLIDLGYGIEVVNTIACSTFPLILYSLHESDNTLRHTIDF